MDLWGIVNHFRASDFCLRVGNFAIFEAKFQRANPVNIEDWARLCIEFAGQIKHAANDCWDIGLTQAWEEIDRVNSSLALHPNDPAAQAMAAQHLRLCLLAEIGKRKFLYVRDENSNYLDQDALFGDSVKEAFPSAASDIREGGNCFAAECYTASVFHLMRAVEHALRALAVDRRIVLPKNQPLDLATWEEVIRQLEAAEEAIRDYPKTLARERQYEFYHGAMMEFKRFKNVFRNSVMHSREEYKVDDARVVFFHVKAFMQILAAEISEEKITPEIWV